MRFEPRRSFVVARPVRRRSAPDLPIDIAFLETFGVARKTLAAAAARAAAEGIEAHRALLASGAISETLYALCLAHHLGVRFVGDWPPTMPTLEIRRALACGRIALADGAAERWLLAPTSDAVVVLLNAREHGLALPSIALTTPSHLAALVRRRAGAAIVHAASYALPLGAPRLSALGANTPLALGAILFSISCVLIAAVMAARLPAAVLGFVFLAGLAFRLVVCADGLATRARAPAVALRDADLPTYSLLVPLNDEAAMVDGLVAALDRLDYPRAKLEVMVLIEADDAATRNALASRRLPPGFKVIELPPGLPRTKPRALNAGLLLAQGELVTVYDAEDRPEPNQLRQAAARFAGAPRRLACLQAPLAISNGADGLLAALFALEYALLFDVFNVGLARFGLPMALGGTSNHFRASALRAVGGWDAWNVTEDADLGLRLARFGYAIDVLASTTWEEAPVRLADWFKQRRRWTKGWMQTLVVLCRDLPSVVRDLGPRRSFVVALMLTNLVTGPLLTPLFLVVVLWHLAANGLQSPRGLVEVLEATLDTAVLSLGALGTLWSGVVGARRRALGDTRALLAFLPYQLLISAAAVGGLVDLVRRPYHWHKTRHGEPAR